MQEIAYRPQNIRETLVELKNSSELAVDLAYSSILFDKQELAHEVMDLESRVSYLQYHARMALMLAAKNTADAESFVGLFQVVDGTVAVTRAAADMAQIPLRDVGFPPAFRSLPDAHERFVRFDIAADSSLGGRTLADLQLDIERGVRIIAIRRDTEWHVAPGGSSQLLEGDVVFARGPDAGIAEVVSKATGETFAKPDEGDRPAETNEAVEALVELKNLSELAIGLAHGAVLFDSTEMAGEVQVLEQQADELRAKLERWVMETLRDGEAEAVDQLRGVFHVAFAAEVICDAASSIAEVVLRDVDLHPVYAQAIKESQEVIASVELQNGELAGRTIADLESAIEAGVLILALHRGDRWVYDPDGETTVGTGDRLIIKGPERGEARFRELATA